MTTAKDRANTLKDSAEYGSNEEKAWINADETLWGDGRYGSVEYENLTPAMWSEWIECYKASLEILTDFA